MQVIQDCLDSPVLMDSQVHQALLETLAQRVRRVIADLQVRMDYPVTVDSQVEQEQLVMLDSQDSLVR